MKHIGIICNDTTKLVCQLLKKTTSPIFITCDAIASDMCILSPVEQSRYCKSADYHSMCKTGNETEDLFETSWLLSHYLELFKILTGLIRSLRFICC